jgi:phenylpyruvate tautomerase PptA (4-oxalocrotonate tautomerase family)
MPLYRCMVAAGLTSLSQRARIAAEVTRIHCQLTGALPEFVHAFFSEDTKGQLPAGRRAVLLGSIRSGRSGELKQQLVAEMSQSVAGILELPEAEILVATVDVPARWVMEGGAVLPEPGDEEAWLASREPGH